METLNIKNRLLEWDFWWKATASDVKNIIKQGARIDVCTSKKGTTLHAAAALCTSEDAIIQLLDEGALEYIEHPNINGWTPLHCAAASSTCPPAVKTLLDKEANATAKTNRRESPFDLAKENKYLKGTAVFEQLEQAQS